MGLDWPVIPACVSCGSPSVVAVGEIPPAIRFAGQKLSSLLNGGALFECGVCGLSFRFPRPNKSELDELYKQGANENWQSSTAKRQDWHTANQWISKYLQSNSKILDVGCFDGGFLKSMNSDFRRFGIEIHDAAAERARSRDISIVGKNFGDMRTTDAPFDAVLAFDVIEHTEDPIAFLADLVSVTRKNGLIIISTGNTKALSWRLMGAAYWYCSIAEHLSFINPRWCHWATQVLDIELRHITRFSHKRANWLQRLSEMAKNLLYRISPRGFSLLRRWGLGSTDYRESRELSNYPPSWMLAKDHFICLFVKQ